MPDLKWSMLVLPILLYVSASPFAPRSPYAGPPTGQAVAYDDFIWPMYTDGVQLLKEFQTVRASHYLYFEVEVDAERMYDPRIAGWFNASGGNDDIICYLCDQHNFERFEKGEQFAVGYQSDGKVTHDEFNVGIPESGKYYLIFSNTFSLFTNRTVWGDIRFTWTREPSSELPDPFLQLCLVLGVGALLLWRHSTRRGS